MIKIEMRRGNLDGVEKGMKLAKSIEPNVDSKSRRDIKAKIKTEEDMNDAIVQKQEMRKSALLFKTSVALCASDGSQLHEFPISESLAQIGNLQYLVFF